MHIAPVGAEFLHVPMRGAPPSDEASQAILKFAATGLPRSSMARTGGHAAITPSVPLAGPATRLAVSTNGLPAASSISINCLRCFLGCWALSVLAAPSSWRARRNRMQPRSANWRRTSLKTIENPWCYLHCKIRGQAVQGVNGIFESIFKATAFPGPRGASL